MKVDGNKNITGYYCKIFERSELHTAVLYRLHIAGNKNITGYYCMIFVRGELHIAVYYLLLIVEDEDNDGDD